MCRPTVKQPLSLENDRLPLRDWPREGIYEEYTTTVTGQKYNYDLCQLVPYKIGGCKYSKRVVGEYSNETLAFLGPTCASPKPTLPYPPPATRRRSHPTMLTPRWEQFPNIGAHLV
jgi:hypothetical protein